MTPWPPTHHDGTLDRRTADVRLLTQSGETIARLVDTDSALAEASAAIERVLRSTDLELAVAHAGVARAAIDQARGIRTEAWESATDQEQALLEVVTLADVERDRETTGTAERFQALPRASGPDASEAP